MQRLLAAASSPDARLLIPLYDNHQHQQQHALLLHPANPIPTGTRLLALPTAGASSLLAGVGMFGAALLCVYIVGMGLLLLLFSSFRRATAGQQGQRQEGGAYDRRQVRKGWLVGW